MGEWNPSLSCHTLQCLLWQLGFDETFPLSALNYLGWSLLEKDYSEKSFLRVRTSKLTSMQSKTNRSTVCGHRLENVLARPKANSYSNLDIYWWQIIDTTPCSIKEITLCFQAVPRLAGFSVLSPKNQKNGHVVPSPRLGKAHSLWRENNQKAIAPGT